MATIKICDICKCPIKENNKSYILAWRDNLNNDDSYNKDLLYSQASLSNFYLKYNIGSIEICEKCKSVLDYFIKLKDYEIKKITDMLEKAYKKTEYCKCPRPEPNWEECPVITCKKCGKVINPYGNNKNWKGEKNAT